MTELILQRRQRLKAERQPSEYTGEQHCNRCGVCCLLGPCQLRDMADVEALARGLRLTVQAVIAEHLIEEVHPMGGVTVVPRRNADRSCHFYDDAARACTVERSKPTGGRLFECWTWRGRTLMPFLWDPESLQRLRSA